MKPVIFVLGSFVVDCAYRAAGMPWSGQTVIGSSFALGPGGKGSNQAVAAARAGAHVLFQTAIGDDAFGQIGRELWRSEGIDASSVKVTAVATGSAAILLDERTGENRIIVVPGACSELTPVDAVRAYDAIRTARVFVAQLEIPLDTVAEAMKLAKAAGLVTVLNPAPAPKMALKQELLQLVDYLVPNESEAEAMTGIKVHDLSSARRAAGALQAQGANNVIITLGAQGAAFVSQTGGADDVPPFYLGPVLDTTGAGDAFCGALAAKLAEGSGAEEALRFASVAAGLSVLQHGAAPSMAHRAQIDAVLSKDTEALPRSDH